MDKKGQHIIERALDKAHKEIAEALYYEYDNADPADTKILADAMIERARRVWRQNRLKMERANYIELTASEKTAVAPPGWEDTVKKMKKHDEIDNPWALAWHMKNKDYTPGGKEARTELTNFEEAVLARRVASRAVEAKVHPSEKAMRLYLREHPKADPKNHSVRQQDTSKPKKAPHLPTEGDKKPTKRELGDQIGRAENEIKKLQRWIKNDKKDLETAKGKEKKEIESDIATAEKSIKEHEEKLKGLRSEHEGRARKKKDAPAEKTPAKKEKANKDEGSLMDHKVEYSSKTHKPVPTLTELRGNKKLVKEWATQSSWSELEKIYSEVEEVAWSMEGGGNKDDKDVAKEQGRFFDKVLREKKKTDKGGVPDWAKQASLGALAAFQQAVRARESGPSALEAFQEAVAGRVPGQLSMYQQHVMQTVNAEGGVRMIPKYRSAIKGLVRRGVLRESDDNPNYFIKV